MIKTDEFVVGTPEEALWTKVIEARENTIKSYEESLIVERAVLEMAKKKLKEASQGQDSNP